MTRIDEAEAASGDTVGYGYLIYAVGSGSAGLRVPAAAEFGGSALAASVLDTTPATAPVIGIETAAEL